MRLFGDLKWDWRNVSTSPEKRGHITLVMCSLLNLSEEPRSSANYQPIPSSNYGVKSVSMGYLWLNKLLLYGEDSW